MAAGPGYALVPPPPGPSAASRPALGDGAADLRVCLLKMVTLGSGPQVARSPSNHLTLLGLFQGCCLVSDEILCSPAVFWLPCLVPGACADGATWSG